MKSLNSKVLLATFFAGLGLSAGKKSAEVGTDLAYNEALWNYFGFLNYDMWYQDFSHALGPPYSDLLSVQVRNGYVCGN